MKVFLLILLGGVLFAIVVEVLECVISNPFYAGYCGGIFISVYTIYFVMPAFNKRMDKWLK